MKKESKGTQVAEKKSKRGAKKAELPTQLPEMVLETHVTVEAATGTDEIIEGQSVVEKGGLQLVSEEELAGALAIQDGPTEAGRKAIAEAEAARLKIELAKADILRKIAEKKELEDNAKHPVIGKRVCCCGLDCREVIELTERTLGITDEMKFMALCDKHARIARDARVGLDKFGLWVSWRDRCEGREQRLAAMRSISFTENGVSKQEAHAELLEMDGDVLEVARVARCELFRDGDEPDVKYLIFASGEDLSAFRDTHRRTTFEVKPATEALSYWEKEERDRKRQEEYFRRLDDEKKKRQAEALAKQLEKRAREMKHLQNLAPKGKEAFVSDIPPKNIEQGGASLKHNPLASRLGEIVSNKDSAN